MTAVSTAADDPEAESLTGKGSQGACFNWIRRKAGFPTPVSKEQSGDSKHRAGRISEDGQEWTNQCWISGCPGKCWKRKMRSFKDPDRMLAQGQALRLSLECTGRRPCSFERNGFLSSAEFVALE